ncbi:MAG: MFS transporter [Rhodospirillaceae bacterium]|nr:MFS transporter [Rhodospirillaceae bacterium]MBT6511968.1 MFS transporter [Rhodospirillaceae bacterium]
MERLPLAFLATIFWVNLLAFLNFSSVFVAMVEIGHAIKAPDTMILQLPTALYAAIACAAPATPYLLQRLGPRRLLMFSMIGLSATTVLASQCQNFWQLMAVLFLHGLFCAPISPATQAAVKDNIPDRDLGIGMAIWGAGNYAGGLVGPLLAGIMVTVFGWRSIFIIPLPFVLLAFPLVMTAIKSTADRTARPDAVSMLMAPIAMLFLVATASLGPSLSWFSSPLVMFCAVGLAFSFPLFVWSYRRSTSTAFHMGCLLDRFSGLSLLIVFGFNMVSTGLFQVEFLGKDPILTPEVIGLRSSIAAGTLLLGFIISGWLCQKHSYATGLFGGLALTFVAKVGYLFYNDDSSALDAIWPVAFSGVSFGMVTGVVATLAYRTIGKNHAADIATCFILATYLGASLGTGILDEVLVAFDTLFVAQGMAAGAALERAFKSEFWVELVISVLLLWPAWLLLRGLKTPED